MQTAGGCRGQNIYTSTKFKNSSQAGQSLACLDCVLPVTVENVGIDIRSLSRDGSLDTCRQSVQIEITIRAQHRRLIIRQEGTCFLRVDLPL